MAPGSAVVRNTSIGRTERRTIGRESQQDVKFAIRGKECIRSCSYSLINKQPGLHQGIHFIFCEIVIAGQDRETVLPGLGDEQPVEWVGVYGRQINNALAMFFFYAQPANTINRNFSIKHFFLTRRQL
jgi:hypothetical protein